MPGGSATRTDIGHGCPFSPARIRSPGRQRPEERDQADGRTPRLVGVAGFDRPPMMNGRNRMNNSMIDIPAAKG